MAWSPSSAAMMIVWCLAIVALAQYTLATKHVVGDSLGWTIPSDPAAYTTWASNQTFTVGDTLVFNFLDGLHNVVEVTKVSYDACYIITFIGSIVTTSPANIILDKAGDHYYICGVGGMQGHCSFGQKLTIKVAAATVAAPLRKAALPPKASAPTSVPASAPTSAPTSVPASAPTSAPTSVPASAPTSVPASAPTQVHHNHPKFTPSSPSPSKGTTETISTPIGAPTSLKDGASAASSLAVVSGFSFTLVLSHLIITDLSA